MPIPSRFNQWNHLKTVLIGIHNSNVETEFSDINPNDSGVSLTNPRYSLFIACFVNLSDSIPLVMARLFFYYFVLRKAQDLQEPVYGEPVHYSQQKRRFKPQVFLYFREPFFDVAEGYQAIKGQIKFRLMGYESSTITQEVIENLSENIKNLFAEGGRFIWKKGKYMFTYNDWDRGYQFQLLVRDEAEGRKLVTQILAIQNDEPEWKKAGINTNQDIMDAYPTVPPTVEILGKNYRQSRNRPIADVAFRYALLHLHGVTKAIPLVDTTGRFLLPIRRA